MKGFKQESVEFVERVIEEAVPVKQYRSPQGLSMTEQRMLNGHMYRRCGGGRQVIRKKPQGGNY